MFVLATWWSWRVLQAAHVDASRVSRIYWLAGSATTFIVLGFATSALATDGGRPPIWAVWGIVAGVIGPLLSSDIAVKRLPLHLTAWASVISLVSLTVVEGPAGRLGPLLGALGMTSITYVLRLLTKKSLGLGDVFLSPLLGAVVGWFDPLAVFGAWMVTAVFGAVMALAGLVGGKKRDSVMAYGPALMVGTALALVGLAW
jgi:leader peptidase (prepilin peptidase)/N-methyltransferase